MRFRIQTDGEKFRVQVRVWYMLFGVWETRSEWSSYEKAERYIRELMKPKPKWRTI